VVLLIDCDAKAAALIRRTTITMKGSDPQELTLLTSYSSYDN